MLIDTSVIILAFVGRLKRLFTKSLNGRRPLRVQREAMSNRRELEGANSIGGECMFDLASI